MLVKGDVQLLVIGEGSIEPQPRLAQGLINQLWLNHLIEYLQSGAGFVATTEVMPRKCVDGRSPANGNSLIAPNAAAGTFSLVAADALTLGRFMRGRQQAAAHARQLYVFLVRSGYKIGGHEDDRAVSPACGCGAEDKLTTILQYIVDSADDVRAVVEKLSSLVDNDIHERIVRQARRLLENDYVVSGAELRQVYIDVAGPESVERLSGSHNEVALVVNTKDNTTLDRSRLRTIFTDNYQVFNLDIWALQRAAEVVAITPDEAEQKFVAAMYYNVATAAVLAGPSLRVIVR